MPVSTGAGTDIFVRKTQPGAAVGVGYWIDVFQNGVKIDSFRVGTKDKVKNIIKRYKEKYHTDRSFLNESQVHVTYKSKEERGETAMTDQELLKKANTINIALQKLLTPLLPVKIRQAEALGQDLINPSNVGFIPETPGAESSMNESQIGSMIATKFVEFISKNQPQQGQEWVKSDDLYNPLKKWLTAIKKKIEDYERMNNVQLDKNKIAEAAEGITFSGDPGKIKEATKIEVTPDVAGKVKEIAGMKAGIRKKQTAGDNGMVRVALEDPFDIELGKAIEEAEKNEPLKASDEDIEGKEEFGGSEDTTYIGGIDIFKKEIPKEKEDIRSHILSFINFSRNIKESMELGKAVTQWANKTGISLDTAKEVINEISNNMDICKEAYNTTILKDSDYESAIRESGVSSETGKGTAVQMIANVMMNKFNEGKLKISSDEDLIAAANISIADSNVDGIINQYIINLTDKSLDSLAMTHKMIEYNIPVIEDETSEFYGRKDPVAVEKIFNNILDKELFSDLSKRSLEVRTGGRVVLNEAINLCIKSENPTIKRSASRIANAIVIGLKSKVKETFGDGSTYKEYAKSDNDYSNKLRRAIEGVV